MSLISLNISVPASHTGTISKAIRRPVSPILRCQGLMRWCRRICSFSPVYLIFITSPPWQYVRWNGRSKEGWGVSAVNIALLWMGGGDGRFHDQTFIAIYLSYNHTHLQITESLNPTFVNIFSFLSPSMIHTIISNLVPVLCRAGAGAGFLSRKGAGNKKEKHFTKLLSTHQRQRHFMSPILRQRKQIGQECSCLL